MATSPRPWRVVYGPVGHRYNPDEPQVWNIVDANGENVIETDCGFYPPSQEDAEMIVTAVNALGV